MIKLAGLFHVNIDFLYKQYIFFFKSIYIIWYFPKPTLKYEIYSANELSYIQALQYVKTTSILTELLSITVLQNKNYLEKKYKIIIIIIKEVCNISVISVSFIGKENVEIWKTQLTRCKLQKNVID